MVMQMRNCGGNRIDQAWRDGFVLKNAELLNEVLKIAQDEPENIETSKVFGEHIRFLNEVLKKPEILRSVGHNKDSTIFAKKSSSFKTAVARLYQIGFPLQVIKSEEVSSECLPHSIAQAFCGPELLTRVLESEESEKLRILKQAPGSMLSGIDDIVTVHGSIIVDVPFAGISIGSLRCLCLSIQSPIDAIYFPGFEVVVCSNSLRFSTLDRIRRFLEWCCKDFCDFSSFWENAASGHLIFVCRDKRPYHVLLDEVAGFFDIQAQTPIKKLTFYARSSFIECAELVHQQGVDRFFSQDVHFCHHRRADKDKFGSVFFEALKDSALKLYGDFPVREGVTNVWVGISGTEKRRWLEELDCIVAFINWSRERFGPSHFFIDGWTSPKVLSRFDVDQIEKHKNACSLIAKRARLSPHEMTSLIGSHMLKKIWFGMQAQFFLACAGTPSIWPSLICDVPGVVHNSTRMIKRAGNTYRKESVFVVPDSDISDINEIGDQIRWDKYSYSIAISCILKGAESLVSNYPCHNGFEACGIEGDKSKLARNN